MKRGNPEPLTRKLRAELKALANLPDSSIDTSDAPEWPTGPVRSGADSTGWRRDDFRDGNDHDRPEIRTPSFAFRQMRRLVGMSVKSIPLTSHKGELVRSSYALSVRRVISRRICSGGSDSSGRHSPGTRWTDLVQGCLDLCDQALDRARFVGR
jgi:hypothetical protein